LPPSPQAATGDLPITAQALIELRDFGRMDSAPGGNPVFSLSPDGNRAAIAMRRADIASDDYCLGIAVVALDGSGKMTLVDVGGAFVPMVNDIRGVPGIPSGAPASSAPLWSADGRQLFYLRRDAGITQLWRAAADGSGAAPLTHSPIDVLSVTWSENRRKLLITTRPALVAGEQAIKREGKRGYHFDARFWTFFESKPRPSLPLPFQITAIDPELGSQDVLSGGEGLSLKARKPEHASLFAASATGIAWTAPDHPEAFLAPEPLHVSVRGRELPCPAQVCGRRVTAIWWQNKDQLIILRGGGPEDGGRLSLYSWDVTRKGGPVLRFQTDDALLNCSPWRGAMLCGWEAANRPRRLVRVELESGRVTTLANPNPEFSRLRLGTVQRLRWRNAQGMATYGDLVLPPDHEAGQRHPLVVVQYTSKGFLRGGSGDDYPIFLLAQHGFAVLSFQRPGFLPATERATDINAVQRINLADFAERRAIFSALDIGVDAAIATGAIDPEKIGITGLSDGASTTQFALINATRFKAAAISSCCDEPSWLFAAGPAYTEAVLTWGYPRQASDGEAFWKPISLSLNAASIHTPLLMQLPDAEYRGALEPISALRQHGAPVDMYVFPDEYHVKSQPEHRLAVYNRAVGWFEFWLQSSVTDRVGLADEISRWEALRSTRH
jgi:hypothetical protein